MDRMKSATLEHYQSISETYGVDPNKTGSFWLQDRVREAAMSTVAEIGPRTLLEVGAGNGLFLLPAAEILPNTDCFGVDFSCNMLQQLRNRQNERRISNVHISCIDASGLPFSDETFDYLLFVNTISSIPKQDLNAVFHEAHRVLRNSGYLYFDYKNAFSPIVSLRLKMKKPKHIVTVNTFSNMKELLKGLFHIERKKGIGLALSAGVKALAPHISLLCRKV